MQRGRYDLGAMALKRLRIYELSGGLKLDGVLVVEEWRERVVATPTHETLLG